jgi:hypothetical protein
MKTISLRSALAPAFAMRGALAREGSRSYQRPRAAHQDCIPLEDTKAGRTEPNRVPTFLSWTTIAPQACRTLVLTADGANPLSRSRNSRADGDGSSVCTSIRVSRGGGLKGFHGQRLIAKKPLRRFLRFTRGTDSLQRPVPVDPTAMQFVLARRSATVSWPLIASSATFALTSIRHARRGALSMYPEG